MRQGTRNRTGWLVAALLAIGMSGWAQAVVTDTPPPDGKKPFYINHYGVAAPHYLEQSDSYKWPCTILATANQQGKLTPLGQDVLHRLNLLWQDAEGRTGELTEVGRQLIRTQTRQLTTRYPEVFTKGAIMDGRCLLVNQSIMTMNEALLQVALLGRGMTIRPKASNRDRNWMNPRDKEIEALHNDSIAKVCYDDFVARHCDNRRLMASLFNDTAYVTRHVDATRLSRYLFVLAKHVPYTTVKDSVPLADLFTPDEWQRHRTTLNAKRYLDYGKCTLVGGQQPFLQRTPLWNLLHMGDSIMKRDEPVSHLRYVQEGMLLSLISLMELDNYGLATDNLETLEANGWIAEQMVPPCGNLKMIHYRRDKNDPDVLVKVLLNDREMRLPIKTDCTPYYHWQDVKRYYLQKLYAYEKEAADRQE